MAAFNKFSAFVHDISAKVHNFDTDQFAIMLSNTLPVAANAVKADITEIAAGNGYVAGGFNATTNANSQAGGVEKFVLNPAQITAAGGSIGPFRYAVLYNKTPAAGNLVGWYDYGTSLTLTNGNSFLVNFDVTNGVFTIT
ncbi:hypothetical protein [Bradyrhizobium genosp. A]|uniref:hypothetical protein n=1 Tax=Bradyrhizobium genosp. A TaxID=83626 RepID=UPI003CEA02FD